MSVLIAFKDSSLGYSLSHAARLRRGWTVHGRYFARGITLLFSALERTGQDQRISRFLGEPSASSCRLVEVLLCSALLTGHPAGPRQPVGIDGSYAESQKSLR